MIRMAVENTLYELLLGEAETKDTIVKDVVENVDLIPSNINLSGAEIELVGIDNKEFILKGITDKLRRKYDYIITGLSTIFKYVDNQCTDRSHICISAYPV